MAANPRDPSLAHNKEEDMPGGDWSGRPGHKCQLCGRSSEGVGPRRGFDYQHNVCGGCTSLTDLESDGDGDEGRCKECGEIIYGDNDTGEGEDFGYCNECADCCAICNEYLKPPFLKKHGTFKLDSKLRQQLLKAEPEWYENEDIQNMKDGEEIYLCRDCARDVMGKDK